MKTQPQQPAHTKGELRTTHFDAVQIVGTTHSGRDFQLSIIINGIGLVAMAYGKTKEEAEANAKRIVTAVNMHNELVEALKMLFQCYMHEDLLENIKENIGKVSEHDIVELLKQAEQK